MNTCVPYRQQPGKIFPSIDKLKTYIPYPGSGKAQQMILQVEPLAPAKDYCKSLDCKDQITFHFKTGCGVAGDPGDHIVYSYTGSTGVKLAEEIIHTINMSPTLNSQGMWSVDGTNIAYVGLFYGLNVSLEFDYDPTHFNVKILSNVPAGMARPVSLEHGTIAHSPRVNLTNCDAGANLAGRPFAKQPTQDTTIATATESYAGLVVDTPYKPRGLASGMYPIYGDCNDGCPPVDTCVEILCGCCATADLRMEAFPENGIIPHKLYYRIAGAGDKTKLGYFSPVAGPGLVEWAEKFTPIERNGQYLIVQIH